MAFRDYRAAVIQVRASPRDFLPSHRSMAICRSSPRNDAICRRRRATSWSGRLPAANSSHSDGPLASIAGARDRLRGTTGDKNVLVRGGIYYLGAPISLGPQTQGDAFKAFPGEHPVLSAGALLPAWKKDRPVMADCNPGSSRQAMGWPNPEGRRRLANSGKIPKIRSVQPAQRRLVVRKLR